jgi:hypothetical protein
MEIEKLSNLLDAQIRSKEIHGSIEDMPICIFRERDSHIGKQGYPQPRMLQTRQSLFQRFAYWIACQFRK